MRGRGIERGVQKGPPTSIIISLEEGLELANFLYATSSTMQFESQNKILVASLTEIITS